MEAALADSAGARRPHVRRVAQLRAIRAGSRTEWLGSKETGVRGRTMEALARHGLAEVHIACAPYERHIYRLRMTGERVRLALERGKVDELEVEKITGG